MEISIILESKVVYSKEFKFKKVAYSNFTDSEIKSVALLADNKRIKHLYSIITGVTISACNTSMVYAKDYSQITNKIKEGMNPLVEVLASFGYPLTYGMFVIGMLMVITGKKSKGLEIIKWAIIGFIGLQFVPFFLALLADIGSELRSTL